MSKKSIIISILILLALAGVFVYFILDKKEISIDNPTATPTLITTTVSPSATPNPNIKIDTLKAGSTIASPLELKGQARTWYFEGSFPIYLLDAAGNRIATAIAQAQGNWMTSNFVPFKATMTFNKPDTDTGTIVFHNDNPSGLPENDQEIRIPIKFQ